MKTHAKTYNINNKRVTSSKIRIHK